MTTRIGDPAVYRSMQTHLAEFAAVSPHASFWIGLIDKLQEDPALPDDEWIIPDVSAEPLGNWIANISERRPTVSITRSAGNFVVMHDTRNKEIERLEATLTSDERLALRVWCRRAARPIEALDTWPLERFFDANEVAALTTVRPAKTIVHASGLSWRPNADVTYSGYFCAIVKFTRLCNLRCVYCHDWRTGPGQTMAFKTLVNLYAEILLESAYSNVDIVWHGGEPTMLGPKQMLKILRLQSWFQLPGQRVGNNLQTNACAINQRWARLLRRYGFSVSASMDGPPEVHDHVRVNSKGGGTLAAVSRGLAALRSQHIDPGVIIVLGNELVELGAEKLYRFLQDFSISSASIIPVRPDNNLESKSQTHLMNGTLWYTKFLVEIANIRRKLGPPFVAIREIDTAIRALSGGMSGFCETLGNCAGAFCSFDPDGTVSHCDKFVGDPDYVVGNINQEPLHNILTGPQMVLIRQRAGEVNHLRQCRYFHLCRGWCPHERYIAARTTTTTPKCCGLAPLYEGLNELNV